MKPDGGAGDEEVTGNLRVGEPADEKRRDVAFTVGQVVETPGMRATILEIGVAGPRRVRFELDRNLDDPTNLWITESASGQFPADRPPPPGFGNVAEIVVGPANSSAPVVMSSAWNR